MASFFSLVIGAVLGLILQHRFKLVERIGERIDQWFSRD